MALAPINEHLGVAVAGSWQSTAAAHGCAARSGDDFSVQGSCPRPQRGLRDNGHTSRSVVDTPPRQLELRSG
jgi:hypothetical protein